MAVPLWRRRFLAPPMSTFAADRRWVVEALRLPTILAWVAAAGRMVGSNPRPRHLPTWHCFDGRAYDSAKAASAGELQPAAVLELPYFPFLLPALVTSA